MPTLTEVKYLAIFLVVCLLVGGSYGLGHRNGAASIQAKWNASQVVVDGAVKKKDNKILAAVTTQASDAQAVGQDLQVQTQIVYEKGATIIKKVPVYVTEKDDSDCVINNGFVSLWNDANGSGPEQQSGGSGSGQQPAGQAAGTEDHAP
jgi:hypothetical protein